MELNFERMRSLWLVSQHGSMAAAAHHLGVTPSAVSQQIASLEETVGTELLQAQGRGVALTSTGQSLADRAGQMVRSLESAGAMMEEQLAVTSGAYRVSSIPTAALSLVRHAVRMLQHTHPQLQMSVIDQDPDTSIHQLQSQQVDLAVVDVFDDEPWLVPNGLTATSLGHETMQLFVPESMNLPEGPLELSELSEASWICSPAFVAYSNTVRNCCRQAGFEPNIRWETDDIFLMQHYVADGFGVALHPPFSTSSPPPGVAIRPVAGDPINREVLAITRTSSAARPIEQEVLNQLQLSAQESSPTFISNV